MNQFDRAWIENPEIYEVNCLPPHSDHYRMSEDGKVIEPLSLNGEWKFRYFDTLDSVDYRMLEHPEEYFRDTILVPGHMELQGYGKPQYLNTVYPWEGSEAIVPPQVPKKINPVGVYYKQFDYANQESGSGVRITLHGVESCFTLWLNGTFIGYRENSFCPSEFELTQYIKEEKNQLVIMVIRFCSGSWLEDQDFFRFSGIFRDVELYQTKRYHIEDMEIQTILTDSYTRGTAVTKLQVSNSSLQEQPMRVILTLTSQETTHVIEQVVTFPSGQSTTELEVQVETPSLWSCEEPNLYEIQVKLYSGEEFTCYETGAKTTIGFREFKLEDKIMKLNGKRIVFRGVNRHEFHCDHGRAITKENIKQDLLIMKRNNMNAVRTSHYPNQSEFYRLCDEYGLYVIDETNLETHGTWLVMGKIMPEDSKNIVPGNNMEWTDSILYRGRTMVERDKNHPCVLIWSCGNESFGGPVIKKLSDWFHTRDSSRLVHYEGVFNDRRFPDTSDMESQMYAKVPDIKKYLDNAPEKPFILCEYSHAMGNSLGGMSKYIELEDQYPMYQGGFIWDFADQALRQKTSKGKEYLGVGGDFEDRPNDRYFSGNGIVFADHTPSPKLEEVKYLYQPVRITCSSETITIENRNLFTTTQDMFFLWKLKEDGKTVLQGQLEAAVSPLDSIVIPSPITKEQCGEYEGELVLECCMCRKRATNWSEKGHEIAFGQAVIRENRKVKQQTQYATFISGASYIGIQMEHSKALVSRGNGQLISIQKDGKERIKEPFRAEYWKAPTDNEQGNHSTIRWTQWKLASRYQEFVGITIMEEEAKIISTYKMPTVPTTYYSMEYQFFANDTIKMTMQTEGIHGDIPCYGITVKMPARYDTVAWYGNGQKESYGDRESGCRLEYTEDKVENQYIPYLNPQECGNKTQVRFVTIMDEEGHGLQVKGEIPMETTVLPYTPHELEEASNLTQLPESDQIVASFFQKKCGVAGDDSWGAPVLEEYLVKPEDCGEFCINITII